MSTFKFSKTSKVNPCNKKIIYLDNNGTTQMCKKSKDIMIKWLDARSNPSSDSDIAKKSKEMIDCARKYLLKHSSTNSKKYTVVFTSGGSESNCLIILSVVDSYQKHKGKPHIITSSIEHKSIIQCCQNLQKGNRASITFIKPDIYGFVDPQLIKKAITPNTALVSIIAANNELGTINNLQEIGNVTRELKVPFHTDAVQIFGKYKIPLERNKIDAISMSFHKLYGPMGFGMLIINNDLIEGYQLKGQISGSQQFELRGGTENVPAIASAVESVNCSFHNREDKNKHMCKLKKRIVTELEKHIPQGQYESYLKGKRPDQNEFIVLGPRCNNNIRKPNVLPNTLLISFAKNVKTNKPFCNTKLKTHLNKKGIVVSIGSACSTKSKNASHILYSINAPPVIRQGIIRISLSDYTTLKEILIFVKELSTEVKRQFKN